MKKILFLWTVAIGAVLCTACGGSEQTPGKAAKKYGYYIAEGKYDRLVDVVAFDESLTPEQVEQKKVLMKALLTEKGSEELEEKKGIESVEVVSEKPGATGNEARVVLEFTYGDETTEEISLDLVKRGEVWLVDIGK